MKRKYEIKNKIAGIKIDIDNLLLLIFTFLEYDLDWNCIHSSWHKNSSRLISHLLKPLYIQDFNLLNLENLQSITIKLHKNKKEISISNYKHLQNIVINEYVGHYHTDFYLEILSLPKLKTMKIFGGYLIRFSAINCSNLQSLLLNDVWLGCVIPSEVKYLEYIQCYDGHTYYSYPNLQSLKQLLVKSFITT